MTDPPVSDIAPPIAKKRTSMTDIRYGIFLRPDPATCWAVTQITQAIRQQFGFVAAAVFAPHATLIGNLQIDSREDDLIRVLDPVFETASPIVIYNHGVKAKGSSVRYDINMDASGTHPNEPLGAIASTAKAAVQAMHVRHNDFLAPNVEDYTFAAHLSLANFELDIEPRLIDEVFEFAKGLPINAPASFAARWYTLFQFRSNNWTGNWWEDMPWRHIKSWEVN
jgi:hypothetical protein